MSRCSRCGGIYDGAKGDCPCRGPVARPKRQELYVAAPEVTKATLEAEVERLTAEVKQLKRQLAEAHKSNGLDTNKPSNTSNKPSNKTPQSNKPFDKAAYQREYMRLRRIAAKVALEEAGKK